MRTVVGRRTHTAPIPDGYPEVEGKATVQALTRTATSMTQSVCGSAYLCRVTSGPPRRVILGKNRCSSGFAPDHLSGAEPLFHVRSTFGNAPSSTEVDRTRLSAWSAMP